MKTTIDIPDPLLDRARKIAARDGETLRSPVEQGDGLRADVAHLSMPEIVLMSCGDRGEMPFHAAAVQCLREHVQSGAAWAIPWPCLQQFFGAVTNPRVHKTPSTAAAAIRQVDAWHESPSLVVLHESTPHWLTLRRLVTAGRVRRPMRHEACIAAICLDHDVKEFRTADRDFNRFPQPTARNPLVA